MVNLPASLTRHFLDASGRFDHVALLKTPDERLVAIARDMPGAEWLDLYRRLRGLRLTWFERTMARAAGIDIDAQRARFLRVLEQAADGSVPTPSASPGPFAPGVVTGGPL